MKEATAIGMRPSRGGHRRQGQRNTFKEALVGNTGDKADDGTLVVLGCSHPRVEDSYEAKGAARVEDSWEAKGAAQDEVKSSKQCQKGPVMASTTN